MHQINFIDNLNKNCQHIHFHEFFINFQDWNLPKIDDKALFWYFSISRFLRTSYRMSLIEFGCFCFFLTKTLAYISKHTEILTSEIYVTLHNWATFKSLHFQWHNQRLRSKEREKFRQLTKRNQNVRTTSSKCKRTLRAPRWRRIRCI